MFVGEFTTPHYEFVVLGESREQCATLLRAAWRKHCKETGAQLRYFEQYADDVTTYPIAIGEVLRDRSHYHGTKGETA